MFASVSLCMGAEGSKTGYFLKVIFSYGLHALTELMLVSFTTTRDHTRMQMIICSKLFM